MIGKLLKIVLSAVSSVVVLILAMVAQSLLAGKIFGYTKDANGLEKVKGGLAITITTFTIGIAVTLVFGIWFYKFLSRKSAQIKE
jgi:hypothetical protein